MSGHMQYGTVGLIRKTTNPGSLCAIPLDQSLELTILEPRSPLLSGILGIFSRQEVYNTDNRYKNKDVLLNITGGRH